MNTAVKNVQAIGANSQGFEFATGSDIRRGLYRTSNIDASPTTDGAGWHRHQVTTVCSMQTWLLRPQPSPPTNRASPHTRGDWDVCDTLLARGHTYRIYITSMSETRLPIARQPSVRARRPASPSSGFLLTHSFVKKKYT